MLFKFDLSSSFSYIYLFPLPVRIWLFLVQINVQLIIFTLSFLFFFFSFFVGNYFGVAFWVFIFPPKHKKKASFNLEKQNWVKGYSDLRSLNMHETYCLPSYILDLLVSPEIPMQKALSYIHLQSKFFCPLVLLVNTSN